LSRGGPGPPGRAEIGAPDRDRLDAAPAPGGVQGRHRPESQEEIWPLIDTGKIKPVIYKTFPLGAASEAQRSMESSHHIGKIMLML
jgi:NADPH:quinone reductase